MAKQDLYETLKVKKNSSQSEIKSAYRKRSMETHPDKNDGEESEEFQLVAQAYTILSSPEKRAEYDEKGIITAPENTLNIAAESMISAEFLGLFKKYGANGIIQLNVVKELKEELRKIPVGAKHRIKEGNESITELKKIRARIAHPEDANALARVIDQRIDGVLQAITETENLLTVANRAMCMIKEYEFMYDGDGDFLSAIGGGAGLHSWKGGGMNDFMKAMGGGR